MQHSLSTHHGSECGVIYNVARACIVVFNFAYGSISVCTYEDNNFMPYSNGRLRSCYSDSLNIFNMWAIMKKILSEKGMLVFQKSFGKINCTHALWMMYALALQHACKIMAGCRPKMIMYECMPSTPFCRIKLSCGMCKRPGIMPSRQEPLETFLVTRKQIP